MYFSGKGAAGKILDNLMSTELLKEKYFPSANVQYSVQTQSRDTTILLTTKYVLLYQS